MAGVGMSLWIGVDQVVSRFELLAKNLESGEVSQFFIWQDTLSLIRQHPWMGTGLGTFPVTYTSVQTVYLDKFMNHAHNDYLEFASDLGLPGALLLFGSIVFLLAKTLHHLRRLNGSFERAISMGCVGSMAALLLHSLTDFNLFIPANGLAFAIVLGITVSTISKRS